MFAALRLRVFLIPALLALMAAAAQADPEYEFTLVDAFTPNYDLRECYLYDINEQNTACGTATIQIGPSTTYTGFYWTPPNVKTPIGLSWPRGINNNGLVAGVSQVYDIPSGQFTPMPPLPSLYFPLALLGVNDAGVAVGYEQICNCSNSQGTLQVPYVWDAVNGARTLNVPGAKGAARVNNNGRIVGWTGGNSMPDSYLYDLNTDTYILMSSVFAGPNVKTTAADVNDNNVVVGARMNSNGTVVWGYTWSAEAGVTLLPLPPAGYQSHVQPSAINAGGEIVGSIYTPAGSSRAFVYDPAHGVRDLNTLTTPAPGFTLMTATAINDNGWIVGYGYGGGGMYKSFVLSPILLPGDIDGDGDVDETDRAYFVEVLLGQESNPSFVARCDLNDDGVADGRDIAPFLLAVLGG
jgi:probable HAF family extracellular repeat protein